MAIIRGAASVDECIMTCQPGVPKCVGARNLAGTETGTALGSLLTRPLATLGREVAQGTAAPGSMIMLTSAAAHPTITTTPATTSTDVLPKSPRISLIGNCDGDREEVWDHYACYAQRIDGLADYGNSPLTELLRGTGRIESRWITFRKMRSLSMALSHWYVNSRVPQQQSRRWKSSAAPGPDIKRIHCPLSREQA